MKWKTLSEKEIPDLHAWVAEALTANQAVHIGTDSMQTGRFTQFVTVVVVLTPTKGGRVAYAREVVPRIGALRQRLLDETWRSVGLGLELTALIPGDLTIHLDINTVLKHKSSTYLQELVGLVVGSGFKALVKPEAWAASHVADWAVRDHAKETRDTYAEGAPNSGLKL